MKLLLTLGLAIAAAAQTVPNPVASSVASAQLPALVAGGAAYNQFAGLNLWASGIFPVSNSLGLYESTTADIFPVRATLNGKTGYIFTTSVREGVHKVVHQDAKNMLLFGADVGLSLAQSAGISVSAAVTFSYVRHLTASISLMVPVRELYIPSLGGWNTIAEFGLVWKPGASQ